MTDDETNVNENDEQAADETPADAPTPAAQETPAADEAAPEAPAASAPAESEQPAEQLSPKEARKRKRSAHDGESRPARSIEERLQERAEARKRKATHRRAYRAKQRERRSAAGPGTPPPAAESASTGLAKTRQGVVVSDKADKTITVRIDMARRHRTYKKIVRTTTTLHAHDEANDAHVGDTVRLVESRPLSRTKRWRLVEILERAR